MRLRLRLRLRQRWPLTGILGAVLLAVFVVVAAGAPHLAPYDPWERFDPYQLPDRVHWLGTNDRGHDIFSELIYGARTTLLVGFLAGLCATGIGVTMGVTAAYSRGTVDQILMSLTEVAVLIPKLPLIIILSAFLRPGPRAVALVIGLLWWPATALVARSAALSVRESNYVKSARNFGLPGWYIVITDILPNISGVVWPRLMQSVAAAVGTEASLSFLGIGDPSAKSWGLMLNHAFSRGGVVNDMWWWYLPPGFCISLFIGVVLMIGLAVEEVR